VLRRFLSFVWCRIYAFLCTLKKYYRVNKLHFIICLSCAVCGLLIALSGVYSEKIESSNFIVIVINGTRSPLPVIFNILLYTSIAYFVALVASIHYVLFIVSYGGIIVGSMCIFRAAFISIAADGFLGVIYLVFFILPVAVFNLISVTILLCKIYDYRNYSYNRKHILGVASLPKRLINDILAYYAAALLFTYAFWLVIYLITLLAA
jgi:hypothetical protein